MDKLPAELLHKILNDVRNIHGLGTLSICNRLSKAFQKSARYLLYKDVVLTNDSIELFNDTAPGRPCHFTESLTLQLQPGPLPLSPFGFPPAAGATKEDELNAHAQLLSENLQCLSRRLGDFKTLKTLSLFVKGRGQPIHGYRILRSDIVAVLERLPETIVNLEVATRTHDLLDDIEPAEDVCSAVRTLLPQLSHLRLHLASYCMYLWSDLKRCEHLQTAIINCKPYSSQAESCHFLRDMDMYSEEPPYELCQGLRELALKGVLRKPSKIAVIDWQAKDPAGDPLEFSRMDAFSSYDPLEDTTLIMPSARDWANLQYWWARTPTSEDVFGSPVGIEPVVEGSVWRDTTFGARCVVESGRETEAAVKDLDVMDKAGWKQKMGKKVFKVCHNEEIVGHHIIECETQPGYQPDPALSCSWTVPLGWKDDGRHFAFVGSGT